MDNICQFPVAHREVNLAVEGERPDWYDAGPRKPREICEVCGLPTADTAQWSLTRDDINDIEYYDQLAPEDRAAWRDYMPEGRPDAYYEDLDRIDRGLKAACLS